MTDFGWAVLFAVSLTVLAVFLLSGILATHTAVDLPRWLVRRTEGVKRRALIIEIPLVVFLIGGGELILLLALVHPRSTTPVRLVAAIQLVAAVVWAVYLARALARTWRNRGKESDEGADSHLPPPSP